MKGNKNRRRALALTGVGLSALIIAPAPASSAGGAEPAHQECHEAFDTAQRTDMESFGAFDVETWRDLHHEEATTVFPSGTVVKGPDEIVEALRSHFDDRVAVWTWTELDRYVSHGCKTGWIMYDTTYEIPDEYFHRAIVAVTYVREHGRWLVLADSNTLVPETD